MKLTPADLDRIEALANGAMDMPDIDGDWDDYEEWREAHNDFRATADPATVLELVRLARLGMDQEATGRAQYAVPEQPQWRGLESEGR